MGGDYAGILPQGYFRLFQSVPVEVWGIRSLRCVFPGTPHVCPPGTGWLKDGVKPLFCPVPALLSQHAPPRVLAVPGPGVLRDSPASAQPEKGEGWRRLPVRAVAVSFEAGVPTAPEGCVSPFDAK